MNMAGACPHHSSSCCMGLEDIPRLLRACADCRPMTCAASSPAAHSPSITSVALTHPP